MRLLSSAVTALLVVLLSSTTVQAQQFQQVSDEQVKKAIEKSIKYLYTAQDPAGHWPGPSTGHAAGRDATGYNAIVTYALLAAGEDIQLNPKLRSAIDWMQETESFGTYDVGLRCHTWAKLPPRYMDSLENDARLLHDALDAGGKAHYTCDAPNPSYDNSTTQYNTLGVWEAAKRGIEFSGDYWERVEAGFMNSQAPDGQWGYKSDSKFRMSMTLAGLTCLYVTNDFLHTMEYKKPGTSETHPVYQTIQKGIGWLDANFAAEFAAKINTYTWVGVERVGVASGRKYFNGMDWYRAGASYLVKGQDANGQFTNAGKKNRISDQAFGLIFLSAGRKPILINKLEVDGMRWDNRPRDIAKLTSWVSMESEKHLLWQVINMKFKPHDFMDAPILYLSSDQAFEPDPAGQVKIKEYIDTGGLFFTTSDTDSSSFDASIEQLAKNMYPDLKWHKIPADHFIYNMVYPTSADKTPLYGIHNGARYLIIHSGRDIAWSLHSGNMAKRDDWHTMANIYHYATERGRVRPKLAVHYPKRNGSSGPSKDVARVKFGGNWNPEPNAWKAANVYMNNEGKASIALSEVDLASLADSGVKFAHLTGTGDYEFTEADLQQIKGFANNGGTILVEAVGGDNTFYEMAMTKLSEIGALDPIEPSHDLIKGSNFSGYDTSHVGYRPYRSLTQNQQTPSLQGIMIAGEPRILFSGDDMSNALLNQPVWGVFGYNHESALHLMTNIVLWSNR